MHSLLANVPVATE